MTQIPVLILLLTILLSCGTTVKTFETSDTNKIGVKSNKFRGTIFKSSYSNDKLFIQPNDSLSRFTPTKEDIELAESILKKQIEKVNSSHFNQFRRSQYIDKNLNKYFRQYVGFINEQGHRVVHINFYWNKYSLIDRAKGYWDDRLKYTSDYSMVFDGGSHFWNVNVNLTTKTLYGLAVNGVA